MTSELSKATVDKTEVLERLDNLSFYDFSGFDGRDVEAECLRSRRSSWP